MAKPTERALKRKPSAVVLLSWEKGKVADPAGDRDFEWFETTEHREEYVTKMIAWNVNDVSEHGDLLHMVVEITDTQTEPMTLGRVVGTPEDVMQEWADKITADVTLVFEQIEAVKSSGGYKERPVRAKKASPAARKAADAPKGEGPKPRAKKAVPAAKKAAAPDAGKTVQPRAKAGDLKKALAAKKGAASKATPAKKAVPKD